MSLLRLLQRPRVCNLCRARGFATTPVSRAETTKTAAGGDNTVQTPLSSCAKDTILEGLNYKKGQQPVLALADEEYPAWLWTVLEPKVYPDDGPGGKGERVKRRIENKRRIKDRNFMSTQ
ncbi:hypothetical protein H0H93_003950 [Arthromyces matolae]|nr:hypothetical protein H0H93_003950 [Arthromyces matolae]